MSNFWIVIAGIAGIILVIFAAISTFHLFGSDTQQQPVVIVKVNNTGPSTGGEITTATADTTNGKTTVNLSTSSSLTDNFFSDTHLDTQLWATDNQAIRDLASYWKYSLGPTNVNFVPTGMEIDGVHNQYEINGIESVGSFSPPFTIQAQVQNPQLQPGFVLALQSVPNIPNITSGLTLVGQSVGSCNYDYSDKDSTAIQILKIPSDSGWCTFTITVDKIGIGKITFGDEMRPVSIGNAPFHLMLGQIQGTPSSDLNSQKVIWRYVHLNPNNTP